MINPLKRFSVAWKLSRDPNVQVVERLMQDIRENQALMGNGPLIIQPEDLKTIVAGAEPLGDGGAVFFPEATDEEYDQYLKDEENGWKKFKERFFKKS